MFPMSFAIVLDRGAGLGKSHAGDMISLGRVVQRALKTPCECGAGKQGTLD